MIALKCPLCRAVIWKHKDRARMHINCPSCDERLRLLRTWPNGNLVLTERVFAKDAKEKI